MVSCRSVLTICLLFNVAVIRDIKPAVLDRHSTVLHVSPDRALAESRSRALASIDFHVVCVETVVSALFKISMGRCGVLLLFHKLDDARSRNLSNRTAPSRT
jgi:hypothetical protein